MIQRMLRLLAGLTGLIFVGLGLLFLTSPGGQFARFGVLAGGNSGLSTLRGDMGGLFLGMALFILSGAIGGSSRLLTVPAVFLGFIVSGRMLGLIADGRSGNGGQSMAVEIVIAIILVFTIASLRQGKAQGRGLGFAVTAGALVLIIGGGAVVFQRQLGMAMARRALGQLNDRQLLPQLPDGLHAGLCGAGSPLADATRGGPCVFVVAGKHLFLFDTGDGSARKLALMGIVPARIDGIFFTHFHSDHIAGLGDVLIQRWGGTSHADQTPVYGPQGVEILVAGFNQAYSLDKGYRVAHHGEKTMPPSGSGGIAHPFTIEPGSDVSQVVLREDGLTVTAFPVNHTPVFPAVGYRVDYGGRSIVISGDTAPSPVLTRYAQGADVLFHEGLQPAMVAQIGTAMAALNRAGAAKIMADIPSYHTTPEDAARIAQQAGVRYLMFYHTIPPLPAAYMNAAFLGDAPNIFNGPVTVSKDGTMVSLTPGNTRVALRELL